MYGAMILTRNGGRRCLSSRRTLLLVFALVCVELTVDVTGKVYPSVQWSPLNNNFEEPVFKLNVLPMSKLTILCPHRAVMLQTTDKEIPKEELFENLWVVDNASFTTCNVNTNNTENKIVLKCDKPSQLLFYQLLFQKFSAFADDLVFLPGNTYYFISTSNGFQYSLDSTSNGHCISANMKMAIYVCKDNQDPRCSKIQPTTSLPETKKLEILPEKNPTKLMNTTGTSSPPVRQKSTQIPFDPPAASTGEQTEAKDSYSLLEYVLIGLVAVLCLILVFVVLYYERAKRKSGKSKKPPKFDRVDSCAPALMNGQSV